MFPRKLASNFGFFYFCLTFYDFILDPGPNPVPLRQKVAVPKVLQHCVSGFYS